MAFLRKYVSLDTNEEHVFARGELSSVEIQVVAYKRYGNVKVEFEEGELLFKGGDSLRVQLRGKDGFSVSDVVELRSPTINKAILKIENGKISSDIYHPPIPEEYVEDVARSLELFERRKIDSSIILEYRVEKNEEVREKLKAQIVNKRREDFRKMAKESKIYYESSFPEAPDYEQCNFLRLIELTDFFDCPRLDEEEFKEYLTGKVENLEFQWEEYKARNVGFFELLIYKVGHSPVTAVEEMIKLSLV